MKKAHEIFLMVNWNIIVIMFACIIDKKDVSMVSLKLKKMFN